MARNEIGKKVVIMVLTICLGIFMSISFAMSAEKYPSRPITIVVGNPAGGSVDLSCRALAKSLEKFLHQPIIIVNKLGGATAVQLHFVKNQAADGYTYGTIGTTAILNGLFKKIPYNFFQDFTHLYQYGYWLSGIVVNAESPWKNLHEFVDYGRKNPDKLRVAYLADSSHMGLRNIQFQKLNGIQWKHVVFQGDAPAGTALLGKHVDAATIVATVWAPLVKANRLRTLATFEAKLKEFPDIPKASELGYKYSADFLGFVGLVAPRGLPADVKATFMDASRKAYKDPEFQNTMARIMHPTVYKEGDEWIQFLKNYEKEARSILKQLKEGK